MNNALVALQQNAALLVDDDNTRAIAQSVSGGLTGGGFGNRISLRGNRFRFIINGVDVGAHKESYLDVAIIAANPHVSRIFYAKQYDMAAKPEAPDCYSIDGKMADPSAPNRQNAAGGYKCMTCPQNVKGSSLKGDTKAKACAYKKRIIVTSPDAIDGDLFALDVNAMSLFGDDQLAQNLFNLKSYIETLTAHQMLAVKLVTRLTFDERSSVPKLYFSPIRMLTPEEWEQAKLRMQEDSIQLMLADVINEAETGEIVPEAVRQTPPQPAVAAPPAAAAPPAPPAPPAPAAAAPAAAQMPPLPRPGRPRKAAAPQAAPAPAPATAAPNGNGGAPAPRGFTSAVAQQPAASVPPAEGAAKPKGFTIDLDDFDA